eukprot:GILJ01006892.1.p1 GENE.GILJ01006892.1~~GILJ01006892.1.p1  ORF type:complete len:349 (+),score=38.46 GILJ01006892.1:48-1094(+)
MLPLFVAVAALGAFAFGASWYLIPKFSPYNLKAGLFGKDLNKTSESHVPEALGIVPATIFLVSIICCQLFYTTDISQLLQYNAALLSICFMVFLGFADDVVNLPWRYKLILPTIATLPLLIAYSGGTTIVLPKPLRTIIGATLLDLGILYQVYMGLLAVFCTNAINIYAGINGLEVGQSIVIAVAVLIHNALELPSNPQHMFSLTVMSVFICCSVALLRYNWYPSSVFVGDSYTYFAGMVFAVAGILGHFSKTLLLFFGPQIINFLVSLPQIFGFIPCPRHRLPRFDAKTGKLYCVKNHWTLINLFLYITGPMSERATCISLLVLQGVWCVFAFFVRYYVASLFYDTA